MDEDKRLFLKRILAVPAASALYWGVPFVLGCVDEPAVDPNCVPTGADLKGPFYEEGAPEKTHIAAVDEPGDPLLIQGQVMASNCTEGLNDAVLDVWQANAAAQYYNELGVYRLRATVRADNEGRFSFSTVLPGSYQENNAFRPRHIHIIVRATGYEPLTTQLYFAGDPYLKPNDACGACKSADSSHIIPLVATTLSGQAGWVGEFKIVLS
ncbi:MAG TPA: hypothetical protein EYN66_20340 [Myxococcales bacterium]|nr:hypothetical protein [Myxococcales bacterium]